MTVPRTPGKDLDAGLRRIFAAIDTAPGFESRIAARIAARENVPAPLLLARAETRRRRETGRLRREAWLNGVTAAGAGAAAIAVVWRHGPAVARWTETAISSAADSGLLAGIAFATLGLGLWPALRGWLPR